MDGAVVDRARQPFPAEPIRTLDALHLATAVQARSLVPDLALLSLDRRVRACARAMGFELLPEADS
jgi:predicted nucleic acid-binding protein